MTHYLNIPKHRLLESISLFKPDTQESPLFSYQCCSSLLTISLAPIHYALHLSLAGPQYVLVLPLWRSKSTRVLVPRSLAQCLNLPTSGFEGQAPRPCRSRRRDSCWRASL